MNEKEIIERYAIFWDNESTPTMYISNGTKSNWSTAATVEKTYDYLLKNFEEYATTDEPIFRKYLKYVKEVGNDYPIKYMQFDSIEQLKSVHPEFFI